jgi:dTDP-4-dehydrorhamnose 3,5-epimerase
MILSVSQTEIVEVLQIQVKTYPDERGFFVESYNAAEFVSATGIGSTFVQDNHSYSIQNVLRGLHYQSGTGQGKLIRVLHGNVFDVAVDVRRNSPTFGLWISRELSGANGLQLWIPPGFAHGFLVTSTDAHVSYKVTEYRTPEAEQCLIWNDPALKIDWPTNTPPILSSKDQLGLPLQKLIDHNRVPMS